MKRASYRAAIAWIAENDSAGDSDALDPDAVSSLVSSVLVADLFDVESERVGRDVVAYRRRRADATDRRSMAAERSQAAYAAASCAQCGHSRTFHETLGAAHPCFCACDAFVDQATRRTVKVG